MALFLLSQAVFGWRQAQYLKMEAAEALRIPPDDAHLPEKKAVL